MQFDRDSNVFVMIQGDVGSPILTWSTSSDGVNWQPYNTQHRVVTNPGLPSGGSNNNPGLASLADGSFGGMSFAGYGSSVQPGWAQWLIYRSDIIVNVRIRSWT